ncbi:MAG: dNTP triphosphohydrolase [Clostridia bacterium]|nr:dNTP triphosphohydrolase [Clostridia bacterium]
MYAKKEPDCWKKYPTSDFEKDYKAIISSAAFRRLQDKTQVFPLDQSDFVRTRLTHSLEVSTIAKQLGVMVTNSKYANDDLNQDLKNPEYQQLIPSVLSCAGLLHDLGNPPFGHFGEVVIGDWFKKELLKDSFCYKGKPIHSVLSQQMQNDLCNFEGNAQALRILSKAQNNPDGYDSNLTFATLATLIKYPTNSLQADSKNPDTRIHKIGYFLSETDMYNKIREATGLDSVSNIHARHPLTYLMEAADDIAYSTSDLEDALKKGMFSIDSFIKFVEDELKKLPDNREKDKSVELFNELNVKLNDKNRSTENDLVAFQKWTVYVKGWLTFVVAYSFSKNYKRIISGEYKDDLFKAGYHKYSIKILKDAMKKFVFNAPSILKLELSANKIISALMDDFIYAVIHMDEKDDFKPLKPIRKLLI